jgi:hypothetical protein
MYNLWAWPNIPRLRRHFKFSCALGPDVWATPLEDLKALTKRKDTETVMMTALPFKRVYTPAPCGTMIRLCNHRLFYVKEISCTSKD